MSLIHRNWAPVVAVRDINQQLALFTTMYPTIT